MFTCTPADETEPQGGFACLCHSAAFARLNAMVEQKFSRRSFLTGAAAIVGAAAFWSKEACAAIPDAPATSIAFTNIKLFDGKSNKLIEGKRVVVDGNKIKAVEDIAVSAAEGIQVIDGGGRTLMPGLIDAHWHAMMVAMPMLDLMTADVGYISLAAAEEAARP